MGKESMRRPPDAGASQPLKFDIAAVQLANRPLKNAFRSPLDGLRVSGTRPFSTGC